MDRKPIFDAYRSFMGGNLTQAEVDALDAFLDQHQPRATARTIGAKGLTLIKEFEGCVLTAYKDPVGILTIGYGSTGPHVTPGKQITAQQAEDLLREDLKRFEAAVNKHTGGVTTQDQFDALVAFSFNVGEEALRTSTLLRKHNEGEYAGAAEQFARWNKAGGRVLNGLTRRRAAEAKLYRGEA